VISRVSAFDLMTWKSTLETRFSPNFLQEFLKHHDVVYFS
jgi:hypothetical protein